MLGAVTELWNFLRLSAPGQWLETSTTKKNPKNWKTSMRLFSFHNDLLFEVKRASALQCQVKRDGGQSSYCTAKW